MTHRTDTIRETIAVRLAEHVPLSAQELAALLQTPPSPEMGDYGLPCFSLAKTLRKAPNLIAQELGEQLGDVEGLREARAEGPYLNFFLDRPWATERLLRSIHELGAEYGSDDVGGGRRVVIEYSSPNIAKHMSVYHLRPTIIGSSLRRIYHRLGYETVGINFIGDWGTGFGKLVAAFERYQPGDAEALTVTELQDMYVRFCAEEESDPELQQAARDAFRRLEEGEPEAVRLWEAFKAVSLAEFEGAYVLLDVEFDVLTSESRYADQLGPRVDRMVADGLAVESEGAMIIPLGDDMPPCLVRKSDGASLYATRDICAAEDRWDEYEFAEHLYVVGSEQQLYFRQLKAALKALGHEWTDRIEHIHFGMMKFADESGDAVKGSTRKGITITLDEVLEEAVRKARQKIDENADRIDASADRDELAEQIGIGAAIFCQLSVRRVRDVLFDWDKILEFEGDTGPYVQYAHARLCSILRKAEEDVTPDADCARLDMPEEWTLVRHLERFPAAIRRAAAEHEPSILATYLLDLCADFSSYYSAGMKEPDRRVLCADAATRAARLLLVDAARHVIRSGLELLGIAAPERM